MVCIHFHKLSKCKLKLLFSNSYYWWAIRTHEQIYKNKPLKKKKRKKKGVKRADPLQKKSEMTSNLQLITASKKYVYY